MTANHNEPAGSSFSTERVEKENAKLIEKLDRLTRRNLAMHSLLVEIGRKLQLSSASIKAAVSSMLAEDFFWDEATQHEFLQTIDISVDEISKTIWLVTLAMRLETDSLVLHAEPLILQEIIAAAVDEVSHSQPHMPIELEIPQDGSLVDVDYEYLKDGLRLLFEFIVLAQPSQGTLYIQAVESRTTWNVNITNLAENTFNMIRRISSFDQEILSQKNWVHPDMILKLFVALELFRLQKVNFKEEESGVTQKTIKLIIPI